MFKLIIVIIAMAYNTGTSVEMLDTEIWFTTEDACIEAGVKAIGYKAKPGRVDDDEVLFSYICVPDANGISDENGVISTE